MFILCMIWFGINFIFNSFCSRPIVLADKNVSSFNAFDNEISMILITKLTYKICIHKIKSRK